MGAADWNCGLELQLVSSEGMLYGVGVAVRSGIADVVDAVVSATSLMGQSVSPQNRRQGHLSLVFGIFCAQASWRGQTGIARGIGGNTDRWSFWQSQLGNRISIDIVNGYEGRVIKGSGNRRATIFVHPQVYPVFISARTFIGDESTH